MITFTRSTIMALAFLLSSAAWAQEDKHQHPMPPARPAAAADLASSAQSELEHVPPEAPSTEMPDMSYLEMANLMTMDDRSAIGKVLVEQLEWRDAKGAKLLAWDATAYYGTDYNKLWMKSEGERASGTTEDASAEVLWDRIFSRWWSSQLGFRHDFGEGPTRDWLAVGVKGLAPYFFDIEATAYFADGGRAAARFKIRYELLFSQRLMLEPEFEINAYRKDDLGRHLMSGFRDLRLALRLRYEIRRELAPYLGVAWIRRLGKTADLVRASGEEPGDVQALAGVRFWF